MSWFLAWLHLVLGGFLACFGIRFVLVCPGPLGVVSRDWLRGSASLLLAESAFRRRSSSPRFCSSLSLLGFAETVDGSGQPPGGVRPKKRQSPADSPKSWFAGVWRRHAVWFNNPSGSSLEYWGGGAEAVLTIGQKYVAGDARAEELVAKWVAGRPILGRPGKARSEHRLPERPCAGPRRSIREDPARGVGPATDASSYLFARASTAA